MIRLALLAAVLSTGVLSACAGNPFDDDPLLKPPQVVDVEKEKKS